MYSKKTMGKALDYVENAICEVWLDQSDCEICLEAQLDMTTALCALHRCHKQLEIFHKYNLKKYHKDLKKDLIEEVDSFNAGFHDLRYNFDDNSEFGRIIKRMALTMKKFKHLMAIN